MDTEQIIQTLKQERARIDAAIAVLSGSGARSNGSSSNGRRGARHMSAEARARISAAQKKRWAARKAGQRKK